MSKRSWFPPRRLCLVLVPILVMAGACGSPRLPPLPEQKARIMNEDIRPRVLTMQAFLETWGPAGYEHRERTQFYPVKNGNWVPQFRVPLGEAPPEWQTAVVSEEGFFWGYPDRGELLGFIEHRLVYREKLSADEVHAIGAAWKRDRLFRTTLEKAVRGGRQPIPDGTVESGP